MDTESVPAGYISLNEAFQRKPGEKYNVIGVCVDFLEPAQSRGTDYTCKLVLHDETWEHGAGMTFRFFNRSISSLPVVQNTGDVVMLRDFKTMKSRGEPMGISNNQSGWIVLPAKALANSDSLKDMEGQATWSGQFNSKDRQRDAVNQDELRYAKWLADHQDPTQWRPLLGSTKLQRGYIMSSNGGQPSARDEKFRLIEELKVPHDNSLSFVELLGEVRKIYGDEFKTELYLSDYTKNDLLFEYSYRDMEDISNKWPGPWGKMTMRITLFDSHSMHAQREVKVGAFVYLRNVQIKLDKDGSQLEGCCRGDRYHPTKVNVEVQKADDGKIDERMKALLVRKRGYEAKAKAENIHFVRNGIAQVMRKRQSEGADEHKSKKTKTRNRKKKENRARDEAEQRLEKAPAADEKALTKLNGNVRCENVNVPCKTIADILDPDTLLRTTAKGTAFSLPFQNCKYRANVRVVDFFPDDIADFAAPRKDSQYDCLSDYDNAEESDVDLTQSPGDEVKWEWRFFLLVEDAGQQVTGGGQRPCMELLVANTDGEYLLNMDACNLRDEKNACELARVKEKLFHLWGDLQERKDENATIQETNVKPSARPFQCLVKEYGVPTRRSVETFKDRLRYERVFRLFGTSI